MRLSEIISMGQGYLFQAVILIGLIGICFLLGYVFIYKKVMKGDKRLSKRLSALVAILACYLIVVLGATLERGGYYESEIHLYPFSSYKEAWNTFSIVEWRNIILNILMFVPLGFLLPLFGKLFQKVWVTYLVGFFFTLVIEGVQLLTKRGIFEVDDLINNTVGCMIGYGIWNLCLLIYQMFKGQKRSVIRVSLLQLPLVSIIVLFSWIFYSYEQQEFGNLRSAHTYQVKMPTIKLNNELSLSTETNEAMVYASKVGTKEDTFKVANQWFSYVGTTVDESQTNPYDEVMIYYSSDHDYSIWVYFSGLETWFHDWTHFDSSKQSGYSLEEVTEILKAYGIHLPKAITFTDEGDGNYLLEAKMSELDESYMDGSIRCTLTKDKKVESISHQMTQFNEYKKVDILSEEQAYLQLEEGRIHSRYIKDLNPNYPIEVKDVKLQYEKDSKGYYQPVYQFNILNDEQEDSIIIPAIRD